jgi:hypothetical protein
MTAVGSPRSLETIWISVFATPFSLLPMRKDVTPIRQQMAVVGVPYFCLGAVPKRIGNNKVPSQCYPVTAIGVRGTITYSDATTPPVNSLKPKPIVRKRVRLKPVGWVATEVA